jgi:hypothetical protein
VKLLEIYLVMRVLVLQLSSMLDSFGTEQTMFICSAQGSLVKSNSKVSVICVDYI